MAEKELWLLSLEGQEGLEEIQMGVKRLAEGVAGYRRHSFQNNLQVHQEQDVFHFPRYNLLEKLHPLRHHNKHDQLDRNTLLDY
ncbi:MAG: hypothetical protein HUU38_19055 [Anaerolineales bacterium]|nr:hypothetical protein [Anaerolineales bacterium]